MSLHATSSSTYAPRADRPADSQRPALPHSLDAERVHGTPALLRAAPSTHCALAPADLLAGSASSAARLLPDHAPSLRGGSETLLELTDAPPSLAVHRRLAVPHPASWQLLHVMPVVAAAPSRPADVM